MFEEVEIKGQTLTLRNLMTKPVFSPSNVRSQNSRCMQVKKLILNRIYTIYCKVQARHVQCIHGYIQILEHTKPYFS